MRPRVVFRTHYQVDEPLYVGLLLNTSTSPVRSDYPERVAQQLANEVSRRDKRFNVPAATYAVDLARGLGVINDQMVWTPLGHLIGIFSEPREGQLDYELSAAERLLYYRTFLDGDGAAFLYLARWLLEHESMPDGHADWNSLAQEMFISIYTEYLKVSSTTSDRVTLRNELDRLKSRGYKGKSGTHKMFIHLQTMYRIGMLDRNEESANRTYVARRDRLAPLVELVGDVVGLEQVIREQRWPEIVGTLNGTAPSVTIDDDTLRQLVAHYYGLIMKSGIALCPIATLTDALQLHGLVENRRWDLSAVHEWLRDVQREDPKHIRFHVDRAGNPAFIRLPDALVALWAS